MPKRYLILCAAACALTLTACTANPYLPEKKFGEVRDARLVSLTGSRIARMVHLDDPIPATMSPITLLTPEDVDQHYWGSLPAAIGVYSGGNR